MNTVAATPAAPPPPPQGSPPDAAAPPLAPLEPASLDVAPLIPLVLVGKDGQPVREWIDTLLMAAVIAKDKQQQPSGDGAELATTAGTQPDSAPAAPATSAAMTENAPMIGSAGDKASVPIAVTASEDLNSIKDEQKRPQQQQQDDTATPSGDDKSIAESAKEKLEPSTNNGQENPEAEEVVEQQIEKSDGDTDAKRYRRRRCEAAGCSKFARFNNACSGHGGRRLCSHAGCTRVAQFGHKCSAHGGVKLCSADGCSRAVQSRGCCKTHGGGVRCQTSGCEKGAISKGHCRSHGGGSRCAESGCQKWAQRHGFCVRHSKGEDENGASRSGGGSEDDGKVEA